VWWVGGLGGLRERKRLIRGKGMRKKGKDRILEKFYLPPLGEREQSFRKFSRKGKGKNT